MAENEEDLSQKDPNQPQLYQVRDKQVNQLQKKQKVHRVLLTLKLLERRKAMLVYSHSGRLTSAAITELAKTFECSEKTLLNDWAKREIWEPFIWAQEKASDDGREDLRKLEFALEEAFYMMKTCRHPLARVGAIARYAWIVKTKIEIKQSLVSCLG